MSTAQRNSQEVKVHEMEQDGDEPSDDKRTASNKVLMNPDILEIVFKHLDFYRLKLCRTVCKVWNEEICRGLRDRSVSYVQSQTDFSTFMAMTLLNSKKKPQELPELIHSLSLHFENSKMLNQVLLLPLFPITKLHIYDEVNCHHSATTSKLRTLLLYCSSTLTSLKVPFCNLSAAPELEGVSPDEILLEFPLLEELALLVWEDRDLVLDHKHESTKRRQEVERGLILLFQADPLRSKAEPTRNCRLHWTS